MDAAFETAARRHKIPAAVGLVAQGDGAVFSYTQGLRDSASDRTVDGRSIFAIASMTKAITSAAVMQLVEQGAVGLDEAVGQYLPELRGLPILEGLDAEGGPCFSDVRYEVTLRQLLAHTAGFAYNWNHRLARRYGTAANAVPFLVHEPGTRWHYGTNIDWVGRLVEAVSGQNLEAYFQQHLLRPLGMGDTSFLLPLGKFDRLVSHYQRDADGELRENARTQPGAPPFFNGGGGLFSTANDYMRFARMILRGGRAEDGTRILREETVRAMSSNQTGDLEAGEIRTTMPERSADVRSRRGASDRFGLGFLIHLRAYEGGRSAGSLSWAGLRNTFYWIDPERGLAAVLLMHFLPFCDGAATGMLKDFEKAVYEECV